MPWIRVVPTEEATGILKEQYDAALKRSGHIWNIESIMSQNPHVMKAMTDFHIAVMYSHSPLSRGQREMLAVVVSAENNCIY